jgi:hypothetical protein
MQEDECQFFLLETRSATYVVVSLLLFGVALPAG